jgi:hypothetical protein
MQDFLPPIDDPFVVALAKLLLPFAKIQNGLEIKVSPNCIAHVKSLAKRHAVLMVNHSDRFDPLCACALSKECNENFYFLASREQFDRQFGFAGWVLQNLGTYSVLRGRKVEAASAKKTVSILVTGKHRLVEFPEGDVTGRNDEILPLKEDGLRNLFEAQRQLLELTGESLFMLPVAMYYEVRHDSVKPMSSCLERLERLLNISSLNTIELSFEQKIKRLISLYIAHLSNHYGMVLQDKSSLSAELQELSRKISIITATANGLQFDPSEKTDLLLYGVRADLRKRVDTCNEIDCKFSGLLTESADAKRKLFTKDLDRAEQLLILASTLENRRFTPEVAWRILDRLELEFTGKTTAKGHRTAWIDAAEPIDLSTLYSGFEINEKSAITMADSLVRAALFNLMQNMQETSRTTVGV